MSVQHKSRVVGHFVFEESFWLEDLAEGYTAESIIEGLNNGTLDLDRADEAFQLDEDGDEITAYQCASRYVRNDNEDIVAVISHGGERAVPTQERFELPKD